LNQEKKDVRMRRIGYGVALVENVVLNQEKKDKRIDRILLILVSILSWFKTKHPVHPYILFSWFKTLISHV